MFSQFKILAHSSAPYSGQNTLERKQFVMFVELLCELQILFCTMFEIKFVKLCIFKYIYINIRRE